MSTFDVRSEKNDVKTIVFSEGQNITREFYTACNVTQSGSWVNAVGIEDADGTQVLLEGAKDVKNLIKALEKALELGWAK